MNVKELKELLEEVPDNYEIRTRSENPILNNYFKIPWQLYFSGIIKEVKSIHSLKTLIVISN